MEPTPVPDRPPATTPHARLTSHELIFLVGYRGSGKTSVARLLAEKLGWQWLDADELLAARQGRSIKAIFAAEGETYFRNQEAALLQELCGYRRHVIATGGGIVLRQENRQRLRQGLVIWLTAEPATLWQRIQADPASAAQRPHLAGGGLEEVQQLLRVREPLYCDCAHLVIDTENRPPAMVAERIFEHLRQPAVS